MVKGRDDSTGPSSYSSMRADLVCRGCLANVRALPRAHPRQSWNGGPLIGWRRSLKLAWADPDHHRVFGSARGVWFTLHVGRLC